MHKEIEWLTVLAVQQQTDIPDATIRRYIRNHGHHLNTRKKGKSYSIAEESIAVMERIRTLYKEGKDFEQVEKALIKAGTPLTVTVTEDNESVNVNVGEALQTLDRRLDEQNIIIQSLVEQINKQQVFIETKLTERDQRLIEAIRETQETKRQISTSNEQKEIETKEQKKGWFARFLNK